MTTIDFAATRPAVDRGGRIACWDPVAECTMVIAKPEAEPELFAQYHRGAVASYERFGVTDALDTELACCADDTALFWAITDLDGRVVGGVRAKGPLLRPDDAHAVLEWAGQPGESEVRAMIAERIPAGVVEMKSAWLDKEPGGSHHRAKMIARTGFHAMAVLGVNYCMATTAAHVLEQWRTSGGVVAPIPATPYPDERYETKMMWWDMRTFTVHGQAEQVGATFRELASIRRSTQARRADGLIQPMPARALYRSPSWSLRRRRQASSLAR